jgi:hypothetical protein
MPSNHGKKRLIFFITPGLLSSLHAFSVCLAALSWEILFSADVKEMIYKNIFEFLFGQKNVWRVKIGYQMHLFIAKCDFLAWM